MLSKSDIEHEMKIGRISFGVRNKDVRVDSSSVDISVGLIYPRESIDSPRASVEVRDCGRPWHSIEPGEMVVVETKECIRLPNYIGGVVFPPNRLTKSGIIMTNPGHIDPGYEGHLTFCLINMSIGSVLLSADDVVGTLLLFDLSSPSSGYRGEKGRISVKQVERIGKDFAGLNNRTTSSVMSALSARASLMVGVFALVLTLVVAIAPLLSNVMSGFFDFGLISRVEKIEKDMKMLQSKSHVASEEDGI